MKMTATKRNATRRGRWRSSGIQHKRWIVDREQRPLWSEVYRPGQAVAFHVYKCGLDFVCMYISNGVSWPRAALAAELYVPRRAQYPGCSPVRLDAALFATLHAPTQCSTQQLLLLPRPGFPLFLSLCLPPPHNTTAPGPLNRSLSVCRLRTIRPPPAHSL